MLIGIWTVALIGIGIWSLVSWGVHALLSLEPDRLAELEPLIAQIPFADELDRWLPGWQALLQFALELAQGLLAGVSSAAPWLAWAVWAVGSGTIALTAALATLALVLYRRAAAASHQPQRPALPPLGR